MYNFYERDINVLPKAKDGNLDYGLIRSMMACDVFKFDGDAYKKERGIIDDKNDEGSVEF